MVDKNIVEKLITVIVENLEELKRSDDITFEKYINENRLKKFVERSLQIIIEACIDIAQHIISDEKFREPDSYRDSFKILAENKIIPESDIETFEKIAMFRNLLVHYYIKIDDEIVYSIFKKRLCDFERYVKYIIDFINQNK